MHNCIPIFVKSNNFNFVIAGFLIVAFIVYQSLVKLGWIFYLDSENVSTLWLASGLLLWLFLVTERKLWWPIAISFYIGDNLLSLLTLSAEHYSLKHLLGSFANFGEAMLGAWLLRRYAFQIERFYTVRHTILFILLGAIVCTALFGTIGALSTYWTHADARFMDLFVTWMTANALGILLLAPVLIAWINYTHHLPFAPRDYEAIMFILLALIATYFTFSTNGANSVSYFKVPYLLLVFIIFSAIRYAEKYSFLLTLLISLLAMYFSNTLSGPFVHSHNTPYEVVISTQVFIAVISLVALALTTSFSELKQKNELYAASNLKLAEEIEQKSKALKEKDIAEKKLQHAQKVETIGNLSAGIAHDFNNMLTSLLGYTKLAKNLAQGSDDKMLHYLKQIQSGAQRGKEIIDKLMIYSRQEEVSSKSINFKKFIQERIDYYRIGLSDSIQLLVHTTSDAKIVIDPVHLDQIVLNLLVNARDAIKGEGVITVTVENVKCVNKKSNITHEIFNGDYVCLTIEDDGNGIAPELIDHIFEPFFTTKEMGQGTGLGLSTVYGIVSDVSGKIIVRSKVGEGTQIQIYFLEEDQNREAA